MKETIHVSINGKRVGALADRKQKVVWVDARPSQYDNVFTTPVGDEVFGVNYLQEDPAPMRTNYAKYPGYGDPHTCPDCGGDCQPDDCWGD